MDIPISHAAVDRVTEYTLNDYPILTIGRFSHLDGRALIYFHDELSRVRIGNFSSVATNSAFFLRANHHPEWVTAFPLPVIP